MTDLKKCRVCSDVLVVDENWAPSSVRKNDYICRGCNSARCRRQYQANHEARRAAVRKYQQNNREVIRERAQKYYRANREAIIEKVKKYHQANSGRTTAWKGLDRALKCGATLPEGLSNVEIVDLTEPLYAEMQRLTKETGVQHHVDHRTPCVEGGLHHPSNLRVVTAAVNLAKGAEENDRILERYQAGEIDISDMNEAEAEVVLSYLEAHAIEHGTEFDLLAAE